jgi:arsenate reductase
MAEALLITRGAGRFDVASAGSRPAARVNPHAVEGLREIGIEWQGHQPRGLDGLERESWDVVITVCDRAREACPYFPGAPILAHWGMDDPAEVEGSDEAKREAFRHARDLISHRIDRLVRLPLDQLSRAEAQTRIRAIGSETG